MSDSLFRPVLDEQEGTFTANQVQGVFGEFVPVIDDAQGDEAPSTSVKDIISMGIIAFAR